jgi:iron complex outermembrane receptor protein
MRIVYRILNQTTMKSNIVSLLILLLCRIQILFAQYSVSGNIIDTQTKENVSGASVYISEIKYGAISDKDGNYAIENIKTGTYLFEISMVGYKKIVERISIYKDTVIDFSLGESVSELNEVVITAVSRTTELKLSPVIIKPYDMSMLNQNSATNLIDLIKNIPGVDQITNGTGISKPVIRGLSHNRVLTLYNGLRQEGQQWGDEHGIEIDEYAVDRIEVVKGPGSLLYGSDGIAGVINLIPAKALPPGQTETQLVANYQSNNNLIGFSASHAGNANGLQWMGRLSSKLAGNYQNAVDGKVYNSGFREYDGGLFLGIHRAWGYTHLDMSSFNTTLNMVEGERDSLGNFVYEKPDGFGSTTTVSASEADLRGYAISFPHQEINHLRALISNMFLLQKSVMHLDLGYQNNKRKEYGDIVTPDEEELFFDLHTLYYNLRNNIHNNTGWETSYGVNGMYQVNTNKGVEFLIPEYQLIDAGGFIFTQKTVNAFTLAGGLRLDNRYINTEQLFLDSLETPVVYEDSTTSVKFSALTKNFHSFSGSIGLSYQLNDLTTIKCNLSRGFRAPSIAELASNGVHEGTLRYEYGNAGLVPETSHQLDIAYLLNSDYITLEIMPFVNVIANYIFSEKLVSFTGGDSIQDPDDPVPAFKFTQGDAMLFGGEIYFDIHPHTLAWLHIENVFEYVQATQNNQPDSTKYLPYIPAPNYRAELRAQTKKLSKHITHAYMKFGIDHTFEQNKFYQAYGTETATPAYTLLSAGIGATVPTNRSPNFLTIMISAENLADVAYQSHLSRLKYAPENPMTGSMGVYNMGRNISLKMICNL